MFKSALQGATGQWFIRDNERPPSNNNTVGSASRFTGAVSVSNSCHSEGCLYHDCETSACYSCSSYLVQHLSCQPLFNVQAGSLPSFCQHVFPFLRNCCQNRLRCICRRSKTACFKSAPAYGRASLSGSQDHTRKVRSSCTFPECLEAVFSFSISMLGCLRVLAFGSFETWQGSPVQKRRRQQGSQPA